MNEPDYAVIRDPASPSNGRWLDLDDLQRQTAMREAAGASDEIPPGVVAETVEYTPTPFIEVRESDGAVAQVWMRRPS